MIEPMIEPIFVILGILASVAIPRLAATREDAEISAAVANLRTLVSDASAYYVAKGDFTGAKWNQITNVPLKKTNNSVAIGSSDLATTGANANGNTGAFLTAGGKNCIGVHLVNKAGTGNNITPAYIKFTQHNSNKSTGACAQVIAAAPVKAYLDSTVPNGSNVNQPITSAIAIGSNTKIH